MCCNSTFKSKELFQNTKNYLSGGVASSLHKSPNEEYPIFIESASGSKLYDVDGNEYIDYMGAFGPMILGYNFPDLNEAVIRQIAKGTHYAAPTESIKILCEKLVNIIPCAERISFQSTGTESDMQAIQLARAYTGKQKIVKFEGHYHGWSEELRVSVSAESELAMGPRKRPWKLCQANGQRIAAADDIIILPWNDLDLLKKVIERHKNEIAAVITEPIMCNAEVVLPKQGFLEGLRELTYKNDILFILDEVITGFRLALGGAQEYFGIIPDLAVYAKAMAGGYPIACVVGKKEIMESGMNAAGTFNANPISVAAAIATLNELEKKDTYSNLAAITNQLVDGINTIALKYKIKIHCEGIISIWFMQFGVDEPLSDYRDHFKKVDKAKYMKVYEEALKSGIRLHPSRGRFYISTAHSQSDVGHTLEVFDRIFSAL